MPVLTTRAGKGSALTHNELDANFTAPLTAADYGTNGTQGIATTSSAGYFYPSGAMDGDTTFTFDDPHASLVTSFVLELNNAGAHTVTWPASVNWDGGVAPTLTVGGVDILTFFTRDAGTTWYGFVAGLDMS